MPLTIRDVPAMRGSDLSRVLFVDVDRYGLDDIMWLTGAGQPSLVYTANGAGYAVAPFEDFAMDFDPTLQTQVEVRLLLGPPPGCWRGALAHLPHASTSLALCSLQRRLCASALLSQRPAASRSASGCARAAPHDRTEAPRKS